MNHKIQLSRSSSVAGLRAPLALAIAAGLIAPAAQAFEFELGAARGSIDTTVSYGVTTRMEDRDDNLVGKAFFNPALVAQIAALQARGQYLEAQALQVAARGRFSANRDDGNLKYDDGDIISNAFKITSEGTLNWDSGGAFVRATYFYDFENADRNDLTEAAKDLIGERFRLLDAFVFHNFTYGETGNGTLRLGRQVISWGESTFIQNGINVINSVDLSALRVAGAELKEAFLPLDAAWASFSLSDSLSLELAYLLEFEEIEVDASGTYFSSNDFASPGGTYVMLGFGTVPQPVNDPSLYYDVCFSGPAGFGRSDTGLPASLVAAGCSGSFPRAPNNNAKDNGQYGAALRYYASEFFDTEFGFYYLRYHSRLPVLSGISVTSSASNSGRYFVEYPEDINLYGISWNTTIPGGWAFQGEMSYRDNMPLQIDDVELLFAGLSPLNGLIPQPGLRFRSQLGQYGPGEYIQGWDRHEVSQLQATFTKLIGPGNWLGAEQVAVVAEIGGTKVWDLPDQSVLRYEGEGTDTGGGFAIDSGALRNPVTLTGGFPTSFSWGYRAAMRADYNNVFGSPFNVSPRLAFNHDVNGTTPGPGGNFLEDRKSLTLGVEAFYLNAWSVDVSYTSFFGGGSFNQISDRDFAGVAFKYAF
ncbi:DUF1302 domain-containing protein [Pseudomarimonas salicorniae]|uniref:DUF1302 domain-containing protein n=1 Tax=Pseudomarimonas salicorniae TaxID=2933270 RepID=A0ABT0GKP2_9GAMM|nr:DUF1302 domain-containing protein [Lysobacter sp. CAU 1642]MCK7595101.1 DUF1302 domain-containing protein [Lysobacter sp. CAU 1642]